MLFGQLHHWPATIDTWDMISVIFFLLMLWFVSLYYVSHDYYYFFRDLYIWYHHKDLFGFVVGAGEMGHSSSLHTWHIHHPAQHPPTTPLVGKHTYYFVDYQFLNLLQLFVGNFIILLLFSPSPCRLAYSLYCVIYLYL